MQLKTELKTDVLVMGAGIAGIMSAISAAEAGAEVCIASSTKICSGSSFYPGTWGLGLVGPENPQDERDLAETILKIGEGMADPVLVKTLVSNIRNGIEYLEAMGVELKEAENKGEKEFIPCFDHKNRDWHGLVKESAREVFKSRLKDLGIRELPDTEIIDCVKHNGQITGAVALSKGQGVFFISCKAVVIASGGMGGLFQYRLNTSDIQGMGQLLALRAGASLINIEFMQMMPGFINPAPKTIYNEKVFKYSRFSHPHTGEPVFGDWDSALLEERMEVRSTHGPFTSRLMSAPVDVRLFTCFQREGGVRLTYEDSIKRDQPEFIRTYFDWLFKEKHLTMDDPVQLGIFAHASNGGIRINSRGETGVPGLFACGEAAGGMHGADRLGGLSTANGLVFGRIAGGSAADFSMSHHKISPSAPEISFKVYPEAPKFREEIRKQNFKNAMVVRDGKGAAASLKRLEEIREAMKQNCCEGVFNPAELSDSCGLEAAVVLSQCLLRAILAREESRGSHYRTDFPSRDQALAAPLCIMEKNGTINLEKIVFVN